MNEKNSKLIAMIGVMIFTAIGLILAHIIENAIKSLTNTGIIGNIKSFLLTPGLLAGLFWLVVCILVYIGAGKVYSTGSKIGPISLLFLLLWLSAVFGLFLGNLIWTLLNDNKVLVSIDLMVKSLFMNLENSLGPAFAATLGITNAKQIKKEE